MKFVGLGEKGTVNQQGLILRAAKMWWLRTWSLGLICVDWNSGSTGCENMGEVIQATYTSASFFVKLG